MEKICILPPDRMDGTALTPRSRALYLAEEQPPLNYRPFFDDSLSEEGNRSKIQEKLLAELTAAMKTAVLEYQQTRKEASPSSISYRYALSKQNQKIIQTMQNLFLNNPEILLRFADAIENSKVLGINESTLEDGNYNAGFCYGVFWYSITGEMPDNAIVENLNRRHMQMIEEVNKTTKNKIEQRARLKKLLVGLGVGVAAVVIIALLAT